MNLLTFPLIVSEVNTVIKLEELQQYLVSDFDLEVELSTNCIVADDPGMSSEKIDCNFTNNFSDGKLDGENNFKPIAYQWSDLDYRKGYLIGMLKRIGIEYALIHGAKTSKIIVLD